MSDFNDNDNSFIEMYMLYSKEQLLRSLANNLSIIRDKKNADQEKQDEPYQQKTIKYARERIRAATKALHKKVEEEHNNNNNSAGNQD
jgi:hypothetical protein